MHDDSFVVPFSRVVREIVESTEENYLDYEVEDVLEHLALIMQKYLARRRSIRLKGIGTFSVKEYTRQWKNPNTGERGPINNLTITVRVSSAVKALIKSTEQKRRRRYNKSKTKIEDIKKND